MSSTSLDERYGETRDVLHRLAAHVLARAQHAGGVCGGLRATPGGFGTTQLGADLDRLRVTDGLLVRESGAASDTWTRAIELDGATLTELAGFAGVDLSGAFSVGPATPPLGVVDEPIRLHGPSAAVLGEWYGVVARALDRLVASVPSPSSAPPSLAQVWPEHFDLALDAATGPVAPAEQRVNLGGSPGDEFHGDPYLYVGPWTPDRPGDPAFWNAPFGAVLGYADVAPDRDPVDVAVRFFQTGLRLLAISSPSAGPSYR